MASKTTIAVLGASGDSAGSALTLALQAGHVCRALARDPAKLATLVLKRGVSQDVLDKLLTIVPGNAKNKDDVKTVLQDGKGRVVDKVLFGIGAAPKLAFSLSLFTIDDPSVCEVSMATLISALSDLRARPHVTCISTTGITSGPRDVPLAFALLYHWFLAVPHVDKAKMEHSLSSASEEQGVGGWTIVRASLLTDGEGTGQLRVGTEAAPAVGYLVDRKAVGKWIFDELLQGDPGKWKGEKVTLTY